MVKKRGTINVTVILMIIGLVLLFIFAGGFFQKAWPYVTYGPLSFCYADTVSVVNALSTFDLAREPQTVFLGECVSALYLVNQDTIDKVSGEIRQDFGGQLNCPKDGKSYVVAVPIIEGGEWTWNIFKWPKEALKEIKDLILKKGVGWGPYCKILSREREYKNPTALRGGGNIYCVDIAKDKDTETYTVYYCEGRCKEDCGPNPYNPGLFSTGEAKGTWKEAGGNI
jgi:hypothetical protein